MLCFICPYLKPYPSSFLSYSSCYLCFLCLFTWSVRILSSFPSVHISCVVLPKAFIFPVFLQFKMSIEVDCQLAGVTVWNCLTRFGHWETVLSLWMWKWCLPCFTWLLVITDCIFLLIHITQTYLSNSNTYTYIGWFFLLGFFYLKNIAWE